MIPLRLIGVGLVVVFAISMPVFFLLQKSQLHRTGENPEKVGSQAADAPFNEGVEALQAGDNDRAISWFNQAIRLAPDEAPAHLCRGIAYDNKNDFAKALADFTEAIRLDPKESDGYYQRGLCYAHQEKFDQAVADFTEAIRLEPKKSHYYLQRGYAHEDNKDFERALADHTQAIRLEPNKAEGYTARGHVHEQRKDFERAIADYASAIRLDSRDPLAYNNLAWVWATCPQDRFRNGKKAVEYARYVCELTQWKEAEYFDTLAAAYAEVGQFGEAITWIKKALAAPEAFEEEELEKVRQRLQLYEEHKPFRDE